MELNESRLIAVVNLLADAMCPDPDLGPPVGPWGRWISDALKEGSLSASYRDVAAGATDGKWWQEHHPGSPPYRAVSAAVADLVRLAGQVDDHNNPYGGRQPRPNWVLGLLLRDLASLNPQPLPPVDPGISFARALANVAMLRAHEAGGDHGARQLLRFSEDWCGTVLIPAPPLKPGGPGAPRPPRPQESLVLGATLVRAAGSSESSALKAATEEAGHRIFEHGLSGLMNP